MRDEGRNEKEREQNGGEDNKAVTEAAMVVVMATAMESR